MWALERTAPPTPTGWADARVVLGGSFGVVTIAAMGVLPREAAATVGVAAVHGGLIAAALVWNGMAVGEALVPILLLAVARTAVAFHPLGAVAYLAVPVWLAGLARASRVSRAGLGRPWPWAATLVGALGGAALALHLFACASRTLGYGVRFEPAVVLPAFAYDLGANVISAELFFRGALLAHLWRRWSFALALAAATGACAVRYCVDPFAASVELRLGAAVYMTLLAVLNGVLYRWTGNLLPGLAAAAMFFAGYRLIGRA